MTLDDLLAAPLVGANRHALELDNTPAFMGNECWLILQNTTSEERAAHEKLLKELSIPPIDGTDPWR